MFVILQIIHIFKLSSEKEQEETLFTKLPQPDAGGATLKELTQRDSKYVAPRRNGQGGRFQTDEVRLRLTSFSRL